MLCGLVFNTGVDNNNMKQMLLLPTFHDISILLCMLNLALLVEILGKVYQNTRSYFKWHYLCPPLKKEGHIALHMSVGITVSLNLVQLITQECFGQEASNLVGR